ncbi:MAG: DivIVA domain-containing protein, partial [Coriobacteriia bacterium]|nr:DivIVA domain-containing protein [Coriobacteriia bacterium]
MKLTPLDIHHKEFRHSLRGYSEEEVDGFLDEVADEFERLFKENIDLSEKLEIAREQVRTFDAQKETLHNTMVAAQRSAEDIVAKAR